MLFGSIAVIIAIFFAANSIKSAHHDTTGSRHREIILILIAGLLWLNYGVLAHTWIIVILGAITTVTALYWEVRKQQHDKNPLAIVGTTIGVAGAIINMIAPAVPLVILGWMGIAAVAVATGSLIHGYITKREGLYPISGNNAFGVFFLGVTMTLHSIGEIGHLLPLIASLTIIVLGIIMLFPIVFPAMNNAAVNINSAVYSGGVDSEEVKNWAENLQKEADEAKEERARAREEKKNKKKNRKDQEEQ